MFKMTYDYSTIKILKLNRKMCPSCKSLSGEKKELYEKDTFICRKCGFFDETFIDI